MVNLSEEEKIKIIKEKVILDYNCYNSIDKIELEAIQGLLDLYQKEKEKNKKLKELLQKKNNYTHQLEKDLFEGCSNYVVRKDELREIIKEKAKTDTYNFKTIDIKDLEEILGE